MACVVDDVHIVASGTGRGHAPDQMGKGETDAGPALSAFGGRCQEAVDFYRDVLGAEVQMLMRFKGGTGVAAARHGPG